MRIESYDLRMDSATAKSYETTRKLTLGYKVGSRGQTDGLAGDTFLGAYNNSLLTGEEQQNNDETDAKKVGDTSIWDRFRGISEIRSERIDNSMEKDVIRDFKSLREQLVLFLWRYLFGDKEAKKMCEECGIDDMNTSAQNRNATGNFGTLELYGVQENYFREDEALSFTSKGMVTTADGRTIDFNLELNMSHTFEEYYREEGVEIVRMCDPLVLNLDNSICNVSDQKFYFDLDADGEVDEISTLTKGNAFLALDKNDDGVINDGSELFGTASGDGFKDLAEYDLDGNGWIDEADDVYDRLKVWYKTEDGEDKLLNLKEANVGAIYLGHAQTDYTLRGIQSGAVNGAIRNIGIFLYEDGVAGTVSHLDIAN